MIVFQSYVPQGVRSATPMASISNWSPGTTVIALLGICTIRTEKSKANGETIGADDGV
jgi:hypothetical protein